MSVSQRYSVISCQYGRQEQMKQQKSEIRPTLTMCFTQNLACFGVQQQFIIATHAHYTALYQETCCFGEYWGISNQYFRSVTGILCTLKLSKQAGICTESGRTQESNFTTGQGLKVNYKCCHNVDALMESIQSDQDIFSNQASLLFF